jgi:hypothetical protein
MVPRSERLWKGWLCHHMADDIMEKPEQEQVINCRTGSQKVGRGQSCFLITSHSWRTNWVP